MAEILPFADLKTILELDKNEADYPSLILIRDSVINTIEQYTNRLFAYQQYTEILEPNVFLVLSALPIKTISSITQNGTAINPTYKIREYGLEGNFSGADDITVVYTGGLETVPNDIHRAALLQTLYEYEAREHIGATVVTNEGGSVQTPELGLLKEVKRLLTKYKHPARELF